MRFVFPDMELCGDETGRSEIQFLHILSTGDHGGDVFYYIEGRDDTDRNYRNGVDNCGTVCI